MQIFVSQPWAMAAAGFVLSLAATFAVRQTARRYGFVAKPKSDRWHKRPTAMYGGIAIFVVTTILYLAFIPKTPASIVLISASTLLFAVGLLDDTLNIKPYQKLIGQLIGVLIVISFGLRLPLTGNELIDIAITTVWLVGITNAINLLDNMDGLAAGIAAIAAILLAIGFAANGQTDELLLTLAFIGALCGFLVFNFNPASIFMGDCGSMFVGFLLAGSVLLNQVGGRSRGLFSVLAVPVLILFVPIFDTTFVTVIRKLWGRKASQGGRDHTSHRLVALGLSERSAVLLLYGLAILAGAISFFVGRLQTIRSLALISLFTAVLVIIGVFLSRVKVYEDAHDPSAEKNAVFAFIINISHKRRIFEVFLDILLITLAYYFSYVLLLGAFEDGGNWDLFLKTLPLLIILKLGSFLLFGVYRGLWRYTSISDVVIFTKAAAFGSVLSVVAVLLLYRFENFSRTVFILDGILLLWALIASRMAFRIIRQLLPIPINAEGRRVLIYGAGDGGEMVLRELRNNPEWSYQPVGFVDDDPLKKNKVINGLRVFDPNGSLGKICEEQRVAEILISTKSISSDKLKKIREVCRETGVSVKRAQIKIEPLDFD
jgi:UDP-GlcNAc:undecaprenyl-phosphate GlcNAc-1-phosphate transferase